MWFRLRGDERLSRCASEGCFGQQSWRLEADGVGANYCSGCREKIEGAAPHPECPCVKPGELCPDCQVYGGVNRETPVVTPGSEPAAPTVTIILPHGYKDAEEFAMDCGFELAAVQRS